MGAVAGRKVRDVAITLTGANQKTEWFDLRASRSTVNFTLTGTFNQAVSIHYSNEDDYDKESAYKIGEDTYAAAVGPLQLPARIARWVRFASGGSWGVGTTCVPLFTKAEDPNGQLIDIKPQDIADNV